MRSLNCSFRPASSALGAAVSIWFKIAIFATLLLGSRLWSDDSVVVEAVRKQLNSCEEYHLEGNVRSFDNGKLYSLSRIQEELSLPQRTFWLLQSVSSNVVGIEASTRYDEELLSIDDGVLTVHKTSKSADRLSELELQSALELAVGHESELRLLVREDRRLGSYWGLLLCGEGGDTNLRKWLESEVWKVVTNKSNTLLIETVLSNKLGKCSLEIDPGNSHRVVRYTRKYGPGDFYNGAKLPTKDIGSRTEEIHANWAGDKLVSIESKVTRVAASGDTYNRTTICNISNLKTGRGSANFEVKTPIPNNTNVILQATPQINAKWRDGKIVKILSSGEVEALTEVKMAPQQSSAFIMLVIAILGLALVARTLIRRRAK